MWVVLMQIIEYDKIYDEQIKDLLVELQNYLIDIDDWHTQVLTNNYREDYFKMDLDLVNKHEGKIIQQKSKTRLLVLFLEL